MSQYPRGHNTRDKNLCFPKFVLVFVKDFAVSLDGVGDLDGDVGFALDQQLHGVVHVFQLHEGQAHG